MHAVRRLGHARSRKREPQRWVSLVMAWAERRKREGLLYVCFLFLFSGRVVVFWCRAAR